VSDRALKAAGADSRSVSGELTATSSLKAAERSGFRLLLIGRSIGLVAFFGWQSYVFTITGVPTGMVLAATLLIPGLLILRALARGVDRAWHRYAIVGMDISCLTAAAVFLPLMSGAEVPKIMAFRAYGTHYFSFILAVCSLSLMPGLVLFAGCLLAVGLWALVGAIALEQERLLSWADMPEDPTVEDYMGLLLHPDFLNIGARVEETAIVLLSALLIALAVRRARAAVIALGAAERKRRRAEGLFGRFVPQEIAGRILDDERALAASAAEATVLVLDIEGFTRFSANRDPEVVLGCLDDFFSSAADIVAAEGGTALSYAGDNLLATFGVPRRCEDPAAAALRAGRALLRLAEAPRYDGECLKPRVGIASGPVASGIVGKGRQSFTVYGDTVNMAQRLEAANKETRTYLTICIATWQQAGEPPDLSPTEALRLPGIAKAVQAYCLRAPL